MGLPPTYNRKSITRGDSELGLHSFYERPRQLQGFLLGSFSLNCARDTRAEIYTFPPIKTAAAKYP